MLIRLFLTICLLAGHALPLAADSCAARRAPEWTVATEADDQDGCCGVSCCCAPAECSCVAPLESPADPRGLPPALPPPPVEKQSLRFDLCAGPTHSAGDLIDWGRAQGRIESRQWSPATSRAAARANLGIWLT